MSTPLADGEIGAGRRALGLLDLNQVSAASDGV